MPCNWVICQPQRPRSGRLTRRSAVCSRMSEGLIYRPGMFIEAIARPRRRSTTTNCSNFDRVFGQLFTVLSGSSGSCCPSSGPARAVASPWCRSAKEPRRAPTPSGAARRRIIPTMNAFDKNLLYDMSLRPHATLRGSSRWAPRPTPGFEALLEGPGRHHPEAAAVSPLRRPRPRRVHRRVRGMPNVACVMYSCSRLPHRASYCSRPRHARS